jgi:hypothetical protein
VHKLYLKIGAFFLKGAFYLGEEMEKILKFNKHEVDDKNSSYYRFQCDCLTPSDAMDIGVESWGKDDDKKFISITMNFIGARFFDRLKYAFQIVRGHWTWREFIVREEDHESLSKIFDPKKNYSELP